MAYEPRRSSGFPGFPTRSDTNRAAPLLNEARGLKRQISKVQGLCYPCSENKGADQLRDYREAKLICVFVFADAKFRFLTSRLIYASSSQSDNTNVKIVIWARFHI